MTFKVKILSILLFISLINSMQSASFDRMRRDAEEETSKPEETSTGDKETDTHGATDKPKPSSESSPFDVNALVDNISQIFNSNGSPDWMKEASTWFTNVNNLFGRH